MTKEQLLNMKLHEKIELDENSTILRVIGGWLYKEYCPSDCESGSDTAVFVPETINVEAEVNNHY